MEGQGNQHYYQYQHPPPILDHEIQHPPLQETHLQNPQQNHLPPHDSDQLQLQQQHISHPEQPQQEELQPQQLPYLPYQDLLPLQLQLLDKGQFDLLNALIQQVLQQYHPYQDHLQYQLQLVRQGHFDRLRKQILEQLQQVNELLGVAEDNLPYHQQQQQQQQCLNVDNGVYYGIAEDTGGVVVAENRVPQLSNQGNNGGGHGGHGGGARAGVLLPYSPHLQQQHLPHQEEPQPPQQDVRITCQQVQQQQSLTVNNGVYGVAEDIGGIVVAGNRVPQFTIKDNDGGRFPQLANEDDIGGGVTRAVQWTEIETLEFLKFRVELNQKFLESSRNQHLWEDISNKMKEKGYDRTSESCKCKLKNLKERYKKIISQRGTMEGDRLKEKFPYYDILKAIDDESKQKGVMPGEEGGGASGSTVKKRNLSDDEDDDNGESGQGKNKRKRASTSTDDINRLQLVLEDFVKQQLQCLKAWEARWEAREEERRIKENEWREREEERRVIEAANRDGLNTALLNNLQQAAKRDQLEMQWREREEQRAKREEERAKREEQRAKREEERAAQRDELIIALLKKLQGEKDI